MDIQRLNELIAHWRILATEARMQGDNPAQASIFRSHAFGMSDGLELAAADLQKILGELVPHIEEPGDD